MTAPIWDKQLVLVAGKGGVGKTLFAAALCRAAHAAGRRVLAAEVTPDTHTTSPLLTHFGCPRVKGEDPVYIEPRFHGVRLAPQSGHRTFLRDALRVKLLVDAAMRSGALTRFLLAAPTFPEIGVLYQLTSVLRSGRFDHVIIDLPATGHAVGLASLPKTVLRFVPSGLIGGALQYGLDCMMDANRCAAVVPTLPESMPVTEAFELIAALGRCGITTSTSILNRLPDDPFEPAERDALERVAQGRGGESVLGSRELKRLDRALAAREVFHRDMPETVNRYEVPILRTERGDLIERLNEHLSKPSAYPGPRSQPSVAAGPPGVVRGTDSPQMDGAVSAPRRPGAEGVG